MNEIQEREFKIFEAIIPILEKHNLRYFAVGGTCIGAIRHHGFIPWDDDIDIAMPRRDYELFRTQYYKELPEQYVKLDYDNAVGNSFLFTKIHDSQTTYVEEYAKEFPDRYTGVFVDIMPVDGLPANERKRNKLIKILDVVCKLNLLNRPSFRNDDSWGEKVKEVIKFIIRLLLNRFFNYNYFSNKVLELVEKNDFDSSEQIYFTWRYGSDIKRKIYPKSYFSSTIQVEFEEGKIAVPIEYDKYLSQDFGEYMKLPPEDKQKTIHNVYICDLEKPCQYYSKLKEEKREIC